MSDKMRWRYGDTNPVVAAVDAATVIEIGDMLWQNTDDAKPAVGPNRSNQRRRPTKRHLFVDTFLGVAMQRSRSAATLRRSAWRLPACSSSIAPATRSSWATWSGCGRKHRGRRPPCLNQQVAKVRR